MRYAAAVKALKLTVLVALVGTLLSIVAQSTIHFRDYMNPPRVIPGWVRFCWFNSRIWLMGGWLIVSGVVFFFATLWINERMRQQEKREKAAEPTPKLSA